MKVKITGEAARTAVLKLLELWNSWSDKTGWTKHKLEIMPRTQEVIKKLLQIGWTLDQLKSSINNYGIVVNKDTRREYKPFYTDWSMTEFFTRKQDKGKSELTQFERFVEGEFNERKWLTDYGCKVREGRKMDIRNAKVEKSAPPISEEQRQKNLEMLQELKDKFLHNLHKKTAPPMSEQEKEQRRQRILKQLKFGG